MRTLYSIGEFSKKTGITIRTLRYYGEKGLLVPARISEGGQRYYNDANIITVQKIVTFKYLDYSLEEIKELLKKDDSLLQSLENQKAQLLKKKKQLDQMLATIDTAILIHQESAAVDSTTLLLIIHSLLTEDAQKDYLKQYIPEPLIEQIYNYLDINFIEINRRYIESLYEIKQAFLHPPDNTELKRLIEQLFSIIPAELTKSLAQEFEKYPNVDFDNWLFTIPLSAEEENWLLEQAARLNILEGVIT
ncbi:MerR family transcriptional regulator [Solibacillus sp. FSL R5-0449]|uniref:MerR family transcriptional regulator n=1 Tax=Solibacillus sp. FSL R5-0449 TaxID=2921639 RepID=UPI0030CB5F8F